MWDCQASVVPCRTAFLTACSASCRGGLSLTVRAQENARALMEQPGLVVPEGDDGHRGEALEAGDVKPEAVVGVRHAQAASDAHDAAGLQLREDDAGPVGVARERERPCLSLRDTA